MMNFTKSGDAAGLITHLQSINAFWYTSIFFWKSKPPKSLDCNFGS